MLDRSPGGFLVEMVKTLAKPIYNWVINTDNDPVMEKFTNRMLPETQFRGHHDEHKISSHAQQGDGAAVWQAMSKKTFKWNPEQNFGDDNNEIHIQCRKNVKLIDDLMKERLKSVSLVITTLLTSLHDIATEGMNQGFKIAVENFERITMGSSKILEKVDKILEILLTSPQGIIAVIIASVILVSSVLGLILATHIIMLIKALKQEEEDNTKVTKNYAKDGT